MRKRTKNVPSLADTDVHFDVLGNETRRRILNLISHESMYFNQSYSEKSDLGTPDRKYYRVNSFFNLSISVSNDNFTIRNEDIEELRYKEADNLYKKFDELHSITFYQNDRLDQTVNMLKIQKISREEK